MVNSSADLNQADSIVCAVRPAARAGGKGVVARLGRSSPRPIPTGRPRPAQHARGMHRGGHHAPGGHGGATATRSLAVEPWRGLHIDHPQ
jgi:hypothetical protein